jgi:hypothetical protein
MSKIIEYVGVKLADALVNAAVFVVVLKLAAVI